MPSKKYTYFVDGKRRFISKHKITGAMLKAREPSFDWHYRIFLEREGQPDLLIRDDDEIKMNSTSLLRFFTVPPSGFGG